MARRDKADDATPMGAALSFLDARPRTVREVEEKLDALDFGEYEISETVRRLGELGLLNDALYAAEFVRTRLATKPVSRRKLYEQMYAHKLSKEVISDALETVSDGYEKKNALAVAEKFARQFATLDEEERRVRVMRRLVGRGYAYQASKEALETLFNNSCGLENCTEDEEDDGKA